MPIEIPASRKEVVDRSKTDVQNELNGSNPFLRNSLIGAIITAFGGRIYDFYLLLRKAVELLFPDTSTGEFAKRWGNLVGVNVLPATQSTGFITLRGNSTVTVPALSVLQTSNGLNFVTRNDVTVSTIVFSISSITRISQTATATTVSSHELASGVSVTISGATQPEYNGTFTIIVTSETTFTYTITGTPATPATGTISGSSIYGSVQVDSEDAGAEYNLNAGEGMSLTNPIAGIIDPAYVQFGGITGGTDIESDSDYRLRYIEVWQNPSPTFNVADITRKAKEIQGVTRVFVKEITPAEGSVTVYFMRDNDTSPIPDGNQIAAVKAKLLEIKPAHVNPANVIVLAPTPVAVNFAFSSVTPNTETMKNAIKANLAQFFKEGTSVGINIPSQAYNSAIFSTIDPQTGEKVTAFTITAPVGNIAIAAGQIGVLGTISGI